MFVSTLDAIVTRLQAEQAPGGMLADVRVIRAGDVQPIPTKDHPAITVDWDGARKMVVNGGKVELSARFLVTLYTVSTPRDRQSERDLQRLVWDDSSGTPRGLLPALCRCCKTSITAHGYPVTVLIGDTVETGSVNEDSHSTSWAGIELQAVTMRNTPT